MSKRRHTPEQIINKLRQAEVALANGATLTEVLVERWRKHYNTVRPHSSLGYRPPAPEALWAALGQLWRIRPASRAWHSWQVASAPTVKGGDGARRVVHFAPP